MTKSDWKKCKLGDVCKFQNGKKPSFSERGTFPVYGGNGAYGFSDFSNAKPGNIVIGRVGAYCGSLYYLTMPSWITDNAILATPSTHERFLFYLLRGKNLNRMSQGGAQPLLNQSILNGVDINLPPLEEQKRIAQILGALDDKIELLQKQNKTLEDMAKAIFKSWFVDFDVVHAKQKGLPKADIMREYHLTDELYDLFPSDFENSSLGPIPSGWQATTFKTITMQEKARVGSKELPVLSAVKTGDLVLSEDFFNKKVFSNSIKNYIVVPRLSFAYNPSRINIGSIGCNHMNSAGCVSPVYVVFSVISGYENYMEFIIHSTSFNSEVAHRASGTVRQSLSYQDLSYIPVIKPSREIVSKFDALISHWQQKQISNNKQIQILTELRDTLLPPLISGKIRV